MNRSILSCAALLLATACSGGEPQSRQLALTYFTMKGWVFCEKVEPIVNGLAEQYSGRMQFAVVAHDAPGSQDRIRRYGLAMHGMVITDGSDAVVWSESGHHQTREGVIAAVDKALGK